MSARSRAIRWAALNVRAGAFGIWTRSPIARVSKVDGGSSERLPGCEPELETHQPGGHAGLEARTVSEVPPGPQYRSRDRLRGAAAALRSRERGRAGRERPAEFMSRGVGEEIDASAPIVADPPVLDRGRQNPVAAVGAIPVAPEPLRPADESKLFGGKIAAGERHALETNGAVERAPLPQRRRGRDGAVRTRQVAAKSRVTRIGLHPAPDFGACRRGSAAHRISGRTKPIDSDSPAQGPRLARAAGEPGVDDPAPRQGERRAAAMPRARAGLERPPGLRIEGVGDLGVQSHRHIDRPAEDGGLAIARRVVGPPVAGARPAEPRRASRAADVPEREIDEARDAGFVGDADRALEAAGGRFLDRNHDARAPWNASGGD